MAIWSHSHEAKMSHYLLVVLLVSVGITATVTSPSPFDVNQFNMALCDSSTGVAACDGTCTQIGICLNNGNGYTWSHAQTCADGKRCDTSGDAPRCIDADNSNCIPNTETIGCAVDGVYPDPYDCTRSLSCKAGSTAVVKDICEEGIHFDACTGFCDVVSSDNDCKSQTPLCTATGETKRIDTNHRMFYYCAEDDKHLLHPVMNRCEHGFFDVDTHKCSNSPTPGCISDPILTTTSTA